jgi:hypothetical protein
VFHGQNLGSDVIATIVASIDAVAQAHFRIAVIAVIAVTRRCCAAHPLHGAAT